MCIIVPICVLFLTHGYYEGVEEEGEGARGFSRREKGRFSGLGAPVFP